MTSILMVVVAGQAFGFLIGWAFGFWVKRTAIDIGGISADTVCPGLALLVIVALFLVGVANAIDYQRWLNKWGDELRRARQ